MWKILKAEIYYNKVALVLGWAVSLLLILIIYGWGVVAHHLRDLSIALWAGILFASSLRETIKMKEGRERFLVILPVSLKSIGWVHLFFPALIWISIAVTFFGLNLIFKIFTMPSVLGPPVLSLNGLIFIAYALFLLNRDIRYSIYSRTMQHVLNIIYLLTWILICFVLMMYINFFGLFPFVSTSTKSLLAHVYLSNWGSLFINFVAVLLSLLSIRYYLIRKSYLQ